MYVRIIKRKDKDGSEVEYIQLTHNTRHPEKGYSRASAHLMNLTVDLLFFDTTSTYFEMEDPADSDLLAYGKSKHKRDDLPQVTIGLAVTRGGIPVRCWVLPGNQNDAKCVDQIQNDMNDWKLGNVIWAMDRGGLGRIHLEKFLHKDGHILQYTEPTHSQRNILKKLKIYMPKRVKSFTGTPPSPLIFFNSIVII